MRTCIQCGKMKRGMLSLSIFPKEEFGWCCDRCIFLWLDDHNVMQDGYEIDELISKDGKKKIKRSDFLD